MDNSFTINEKYFSLDSEESNEVKIVQYYKLTDRDNLLRKSEICFPYFPALPPELDVFSDLPDSVNENNHASKFLKELKECIINYDRSIIGNVSLSKLLETEHTDTVIVIEWIYNYFRVFFGFDKKEGDFFGRVYSDKENGVYSSNVFKMTEDEYRAVAQNNLDYIIEAINGR